MYQKSNMLWLRSILLFLCFPIYSAHAIELEQIQPSTLHGKKIGYYIGSFDPLHLGHEKVVHTILEQGLCDYILIYPVWGGDDYKKRIDVNIRLEMLFAVFKDHPKVLVTKMKPDALQNALTQDNPDQNIDGQPAVKSCFPDAEYIGIIGSDTALWTISDQKYLSLFMRGVKIAEKYKEHTTGVMMALPVTGFIVAHRQGDSLQSLEGRIKDRPIIKVIETEYPASSSTKIRKQLKSGESIDGLVSPPVLEIINKHQLYS